MCLLTLISFNVNAQFKVSNITLPDGTVEAKTDSLFIIANSKTRVVCEIFNSSLNENNIAQQVIDDIVYLGVEPQNCKAFYVCRKAVNNISGVGIKGFYNSTNNHKNYVASATFALLNEAKYIRISAYTEALYAVDADHLVFDWMKNEGNATNNKSFGDGTTIFRNTITGLAQYMSLFDSKQLTSLTNDAYKLFKITFGYDAPASQVMNKANLHLNSSIDTKGNTIINDANSKKCTLWAILIADTNDENIGKEDGIDNRNLNNELKSICRCIGINCEIVNITGADTYNKANLANAINNLKPGKDDIVFFCYNGHGFRWDDQKDYYPMMYLYNGIDEFSNQYVSVTDIYNAIVAKGARLNFIFADCCNSKFGMNAPLQKGNTLFSRAANNVSINRLNDLFLNSKGTTLVAAAKPGEYAFSFTDYGSAYTQCFIQTLRDEVSNTKTTEASWKNVVDGTISAAIKLTSDCTNTQHGIRYMTVTKK